VGKAGRVGSVEALPSLLKKALSKPFVEQIHLSFGHHPQVIQVQKFVTILERCLW